jgi:integrase
MVEDLGLKSIDDLLLVDVKQLTISLQKWINKRVSETSIKTIQFESYLVRSFFSHYDIEIPLKKLKTPRKAAKSRIDSLPSIGEIQKLISSCKSRRMRLILMTLALTGLRLNECLSLKREYIDLEKGVIMVPSSITKTGKPREVPIPSELKNELEEYFEKYFPHKQGYIFSVQNNPEKRIPTSRFYEKYIELLQRLGLDEKTPDGTAYRLHPHVFRKWYRTMLESAGVNKLLIDLWIGHSSGVEKFYYLPTPEMIKQELEKADRVLRIFGQAAAPRQIEEYREHIDMLWNALLRVAETVSEENPKLLEKLERLGIRYAQASGPEGSFTGMIVKPGLLKRSR